jgi:signal transduction histidine kinase
MKTLVLRIYLALVAVLALFALAGGALVKWQFEREREQAQRAVQERLAPWAEFAQSVLPEADRPREEQSAALDEFARRWRTGLALESPDGRRIAASAGFVRREQELRERTGADRPGEQSQALARNVVRLALPDGRVLLVWRTRMGRDALHHGPQGPGASPGPAESLPPGAWRAPPEAGWSGATPPRWWAVGPGGLVVVLGLLFVAVAAAAWPVARRLTRRLETLQRGVEAFGDGRLQQRVDVEGRDEISALARSFNQAAERIEALVASNRSLLANASHEIRSPLARLKMAVSMLDDAPDAVPDADPKARERRSRLRAEVDANIAELDALVEEVLLASRLEARAALESSGPVDLDALVRGEVDRLPPRPGFAITLGAMPPEPARVLGDERLLRRLVRNLLENARRYGGDAATVSLRLESGPHGGPAWVTVVVEDQGPGVPAEHRERIFEPFFRLPGHAEQHGSVGLGLSLVRQIAQRHAGQVHCEPTPSGRGSRFVLRLPAMAGAGAGQAVAHGIG